MSSSARDVVTMLERECAEACVRVMTGVRVLSVRQDGLFVVETSAGELRAKAVVIATGGLSIPKMGATGFGYRIAEQFGLRVVECRPALVPLVFGEDDRARWCDLTGLSAEVTAAAGDRRRRRIEGADRPGACRGGAADRHPLGGMKHRHPSESWDDDAALPTHFALCLEEPAFGAL